MNPSHKGALSEMAACSWLLQQGYHVFRNVSPVGPADIIAWKPDCDETLRIDVKTVSASKCGRYLAIQKLKDDQVKSGVVPLYVLPDGKIVIGEISSKEG